MERPHPWKMTLQTSFEKYYFATSAIVFVVLALVGFSGSLQMKTAQGFVVTPRIIFHALGASLWLLLFVVQTQLAFRRKLAWHMKLGKAGIIVFLFFLIATLYMLFTARAAYPDLDPTLINTEIGVRTLDLIITLTLFIFALANIRRPYLHKRSMLYVNFLVVAPAITRLPNFFGYGENIIVIVVVSVLLILPLLIHDLIKARLKLKLASLGLFLFLLFSGSFFPMEYWRSDEWNSMVEKISAWLL